MVLHLIKILGSNKYYNPKYHKNIFYNFLILPEAFTAETELLYEFTIKAAIQNPDCNFYFRCHPMISNFYKKKYNRLKNFIFSNKEFSDDMKRCTFSIYRGSAAVMETVSNGLIPIYLEDNSSININPLYKVMPKKLIIKKPNDFKKLIGSKICQKKLNKIRKYNENYFMKLNPKIVYDYI